jgi:hypothetical protein
MDNGTFVRAVHHLVAVGGDALADSEALYG